MKKWVVVCTVAVLVLAVGGGTGYYFYDKHNKAVAAAQEQKKIHDYGVTLNTAVLDMLKGTMQATMMCGKFSTDWSTAIDNGSVTIGDKFAFGFNEAIQYQEEAFQSDGSVGQITSNKSDVDKFMQASNNPPEQFKQAYNTAMEMYDSYTQLMSEAQAPSGSLVNFNSTTDQLEATINKKADEFKIELPQQ